MSKELPQSVAHKMHPSPPPRGGQGRAARTKRRLPRETSQGSPRRWASKRPRRGRAKWQLASVFLTPTCRGRIPGSGRKFPKRRERTTREERAAVQRGRRRVCRMGRQLAEASFTKGSVCDAKLPDPQPLRTRGPEGSAPRGRLPVPRPQSAPPTSWHVRHQTNLLPRTASASREQRWGPSGPTMCATHSAAGTS